MTQSITMEVARNARRVMLAVVVVLNASLVGAATAKERAAHCSHVMRNSKRVVVAGLASILVVGLSAVSAARGQDDRNDGKTKKIRIVTVVKRAGLGWFERMEEGIKQFAAQNGVDATMMSPDDADPQKQVEIIRKLIAEKPDAITVCSEFAGGARGGLEAGPGGGN